MGEDRAAMGSCRLGHEAILASAGSGKTYQLTNRIIQLLAAGVAPDRIAALTFTKKAAGEFFDAVLQKLAQAARQPEYGRMLGQELGLGDVDYLSLLKSFVRAQSRLQFGTLDSFFFQMLSLFPYEHGLTAPPEIMDEPAVVAQRLDLLQEVFTVMADDTVFALFAESFKQATWGQQERRITDSLIQFIRDYGEVYQGEPRSEKWAQWQDWVAIAPERVSQRRREQIGELRQALLDAAMTQKQELKWGEWLEALGQWEAVLPLPKSWDNWLKNNLLPVWSLLGQQEVEVMVNRKKQRFTVALGALLLSLLQTCLLEKMMQQKAVTEGLFALLDQYYRLYLQRVQRESRVAFSDVVYLLEQQLRRSEQWYSWLTYRWNGQIDHWLLDEFQDTSRRQWNLIAPMIDEVVQSEGDKSFFYVGDVKQSIYSWRSGEPRLFHEVWRHYQGDAERGIALRKLQVSYRSGAAVLQAVNEVFGADAVMRGLFPEASVDQWAEAWGSHEAVDGDVSGVVRWQEVEKGAVWSSVAATLDEVDPLGKGLSCAIIVQSNQQVAEAVQYLRAHTEHGVVSASHVQLLQECDWVRLFYGLWVYLLQPTAHYEQRYLSFTPLGTWCAAEGWSSLAVLDEAYGVIHERGFRALVSLWMERLREVVAPSRFSEQALHYLLEAMHALDVKGSKDVFAAVHAVRELSIPAESSGEAIEVMTIHKSKGLGFDVVLLPDLGGNRLAQRRDELAVQRQEGGEVEWVWDLPSSTFLAMEEGLQKHVAQAEEAACYEAFCKLYVAMTRAKRALYLFSEQRSRQSSSHNYLMWLDQALPESDLEGQRFVVGDLHWYEQVNVVSQPLPAVADAIAWCAGSVVESPQRVRPVTGWSALPDWREESGSRLRLGQQCHQCLAQVERVPAKEGWPLDWQAWCGEHELAAEAQSFLEVFLSRADVQPHFYDLPAYCQVWREQAFEMIWQGQWVSGVFDRVLLFAEQEGGPWQRAVVIDFKLKAPRDDAVQQRYQEQMNRYERAVSQLTGLPMEAVEAQWLYLD